MIVISIVAAVAAIALVLMGVGRFDGYAQRRFGYRFFTRGAFGLAVVALLCLTHGHRWWHASQTDMADALNGIALMVVGVGVTLAVVIRNVRHTDLVIGSVGSALQLSLFGVVAWVGMFALAAVLALFVLMLIFGLGAVRPVWVINRW